MVDIGQFIIRLHEWLVAPEVGLYRDDGLAICKATPKEIEKNKQEGCQVFKSNGLKITIEANKKVVNFLDVTFNLTNGCYEPFMKPNNKLSYVHQHRRIQQQKRFRNRNKNGSVTFNSRRQVSYHEKYNLSPKFPTFLQIGIQANPSIDCTAFRYQ